MCLKRPDLACARVLALSCFAGAFLKLSDSVQRSHIVSTKDQPFQRGGFCHSAENKGGKG